jgi:ABC-type multidrug transport system fused ATPase/permease subunit
MLLGAVLETVGLGMFLPVLQVVSQPDRLAETPVVRDLYAFLAPGDPQRFFMLTSVALFVFFVVKNLYLGGLIYLQSRFVLTRQAIFSRDLMCNYLRRPYLFYLSRNSADILRNVKDSGPYIFQAGLMPLLSLLLEAMLATGVVAFLIALDPTASLSVGALLALSSFIFYRLTQARITRWADRVEALNRDIIRWVQQSIGAVKESMVLGREQFFTDRVAEPNFEKAHYRALFATASYLPRLFIEAIVVAGMVAVAAVILWRGQSLQDVIPVLGVFAVGAFRLVPSASRIVTAVLQIKESSASVQSVLDDLGAEQELRPDDRGKPAIAFDRTIALEGVSFLYPGAAKGSIESVSLTIPKGQSVAFVGPSGAGKTTAVDILLGLLQPTAGRLLVDGVDVAANLRSWQDRIGYVPQTIYLLDDSLRRNIALGIADADIDEDRIRRAVEAAHLTAVVAGLPQGLDTVVGERGARLSGGQRQRVGIARALYHDPNVLILDEATSSLDNETEREISRSLEGLSGTKTVILIAHRMSTVLKCDRLFFLADGRLVDSGSYADLARRNRDFQRMIQLADVKEAS